MTRRKLVPVAIVSLMTAGATASAFADSEREDEEVNAASALATANITLQQAIAASTSRPLANLLTGLNIRHLGATNATVVARAMGHMDRLMEASEEEIAAIEGIGPTIAHSVYEFFQSEHNRAVIGRLRQAGVNFVGPAAPMVEQTLAIYSEHEP